MKPFPRVVNYWYEQILFCKHRPHIEERQTENGRDVSLQSVPIHLEQIWCSLIFIYDFANISIQPYNTDFTVLNSAENVFSCITCNVVFAFAQAINTAYSLIINESLCQCIMSFVRNFCLKLLEMYFQTAPCLLKDEHFQFFLNFCSLELTCKIKNFINSEYNKCVLSKLSILTLKRKF